MALTGKKRKFADSVLAGKSNKDAAIAAGYSAATASAAGSRLVKDKEIAAYLATHKKPASKKSATKPAPKKEVPVAGGGRPTFDLKRALQHPDPRTFLLAAMNDEKLDEKLRIDAAKALMPFMHGKAGEVKPGKKDQRSAAAKDAAKGRFAPGAPPTLVVNNKR